MMSSHPVVMLGLAVLGIFLFSIFFLNSAAWRVSPDDQDGRMTLAEWMERVASEDDDAQRSRNP